MQIVIDIPEEGFGIDIEDKFQEFFKRIKAEIKHHMINETNLVCGTYELETIEMFMQALANSTPLPKGHGVLKDVTNLMRGLYTDMQTIEETFTSSDVYKMIDEECPTIIKTDFDKRNEEGK